METTGLAVIEISISVLLSALAVTVAITGASPLLIQLGAYQYISSPLSVKILCQNRELEEIEWWRFDSDEVAKRIPDQMGGPVISMSSNREYDIRIDRIEVKLPKDRSEWTIKKPTSQWTTKLESNRFLIYPDPFTKPHATRGEEESIPRFLSPTTNSLISFPLKPAPIDAELEITVYPSVSSNEVDLPLIGSLPRFYGTLDLKPVQETYSVTE